MPKYRWCVEHNGLPLSYRCEETLHEARKQAVHGGLERAHHLGAVSIWVRANRQTLMAMNLGRDTDRAKVLQIPQEI